MKVAYLMLICSYVYCTALQPESYIVFVTQCDVICLNYHCI